MCSSCLLQDSQTQSLQTLSAIVSHFQKLFDVNSLNGVYPRMNEVYTKLGEMTNAMKNLRELLELGKDLPCHTLFTPFQRKEIGEKLTSFIENNVELLRNKLGIFFTGKIKIHSCQFTVQIANPHYL